MPLLETVDQAFSTLIVWLIGFLIVELVRKKFYLKREISYIIYIWHTFFSFVYILYLEISPGDALGYYLKALSGGSKFFPGTPFVEFFASLFVIPFHLSYFGTFLLFNIVGSLGLLAFYASLNALVKEKSRFVRLLSLVAVFLPSISFWTAALGKDSLSFMATGFALWAALNLKKRVLLMIFAIFIMGMVRPHIAGIFLIALSIAFIIDKNISLFPRMVLMILSLVVASVIVPFAMKYAGLENVSQAADVLEYVEKRQSYNQDGGGGIDISSMSLPVQLYTYAFRPLPFEAHTIAALLASFDNLFLLFLLFLFLKGFYKKRVKNSFNMVFIVSFTMITWIILATTTANLGIAVRQKWMFVPFLVFLFFMYIGETTTRLDNKNNRRKKNDFNKTKNL